jgi:hypothetical protein
MVVPGGTVLYSDDELTRAVEKSISLMSRLLPKRTYVEAALTAPMIISTHLLDISPFLSDFIRIDRIEYPANESPPEFLTADIMKTHLLFREDPTLTVGNTIRIIYYSKWTAPTLIANGDYPSHLDNAIIVGSTGQALIFKSEKYLQLAAAAASETAVTITTDVTDLITLAKAALASASAAFASSLVLTNVATPLGGAVTDLSSASSALSTALGYLNSGLAYINAATRGDRVADNYGSYGDVGSRIGTAYVQAASQNAAIAQAYLDSSTRQGAAGNGYVQAASQYVALISKLLDTSGETSTITTQLLDVSGRFLASGQAKINEMLAALGTRVEMQSQRSDSPSSGAGSS